MRVLLLAGQTSYACKTGRSGQPDCIGTTSTSKTVGTGGLFGRHAMGENTTSPGEVLLFIFQQGLRDHTHRGTLVVPQQYSKILLSYHNNIES